GENELSPRLNQTPAVWMHRVAIRRMGVGKRDLSPPDPSDRKSGPAGMNLSSRLLFSLGHWLVPERSASECPTSDTSMWGVNEGRSPRNNRVGGDMNSRTHRTLLIGFLIGALI